MSTVRGRRLCLLLGAIPATAIVAASAAGTACELLSLQEPDSRWALQRQADKESLRRSQAIQTELAELGDHEWAGVYRSRGKWPDELLVSPESGWTLYHGSYCGTCAGWRGFGKVLAAKKDRLELEVEHGPKSGGLDDTLYLVPWGDLTFAVPEWRMPSFCAEYSDGWSIPYALFRYIGDDPGFDYETVVRPVGAPAVPEEYRHRILDRPIECKLIGPETWRSEEAYRDRVDYYAVCQTDAGSDKGLAIGMRLHRKDWPRRGTIESVTAQGATVVFYVGSDRESVVGELQGSRVSTRHPKAGWP